MKTGELVTTEEICTRYRVERTFIYSLYESGLIEIVRVEQQEYLHSDKIGDFEKMRRLHYDLQINIEGIEAIHHLLKQLKQLQKDNLRLKNRLNLYEEE